MFDLKELSDNELKQLCEIISYQAIKQIFIDNPRKCNRLVLGDGIIIKKSNNDIFKIVKFNLSNAFIISTISGLTSALFEEINESVDLYDKSGNRLIALCNVLSLSQFKDNIGLYCKLQEDKYSENEVEMIRYIVDLLKEFDDSKLKAEQSLEYEKTIEKLNESIIKLSNEIAEKKSLIENLETEFKTAQAQIQDANKTVASLKSELSEIKREKENAVIAAPNQVPYNKDLKFKYTSICISKYIERYGQWEYRLKRLADIDENGEITLFRPISDMPKTFENRQLLYPEEGERISENIVGIWNWNVIINNNNPEKDFVKTSRNVYYNPITIIVVSLTMDDLKKALINGIKVDVVCSRYIFVVKNKFGTYDGLLIESREFTVSSNHLTVKPDVDCLPKYGISSSKVIVTDEVVFYNSLNLDDFMCYEQMRNVSETVRNIVVKRASWQAFKDMGIASKDWQAAKDFLSTLPLSDICCEISERCKCSLTDASEYLNGFIKSAEEYLTGNGEEYKALENAIKNSSNPMQKCKEILRSEWESENAPKIKSSEDKLLSLNEEINSRKIVLDSIDKDLSQKESIAAQVEKKVIDQIADAQRNAADFISKMGFVLPFSPKQKYDNKKSLVIPGKPCDYIAPQDKMEENDWLDICTENFNIVGIANNFYDELAVFMCAACFQNIPLILSGPNGKNIADAFSCSVFGKSAAYVYCTDNWDVDDIQLIKKQMKR